MAGMKAVDIPYIFATNKTLEGFGRLTESIESTPVAITKWPGQYRPVKNGNQAGIIKEALFFDWNQESGDIFTETEGVWKKRHIGFRKDDDIYIWFTNYHPDGTQVVQSPTLEPFMIVMAKPSGDFEVKPDAHVAFYIPEGKTLTINAGVWHRAAFPLKSNSMMLKNKQGKVHGVVTFDSLKEFGVYLRIKNAFQCPNQCNMYPNMTPHKNSFKSIEQFTLDPAFVDAVKATASTNKTGQLCVNVPLKLATQESIQGFGHLIKDSGGMVVSEKWPSRGRFVARGNEGGEISQAYSTKWEGDEVFLFKDTNGNEEPERLKCALKLDNNLYVSKVNRHLDSNYVMKPFKNGSYIVVLSKNSSDETIKPADFTAFVIDGKHGISIDAGIWMSTTMTCAKGMTKWGCKHGAVNATVEADFEEEYGVIMQVKDFQTRPCH